MDYLKREEYKKESADVARYLWDRYGSLLSKFETNFLVYNPVAREIWEEGGGDAKKMAVRAWDEWEQKQIRTENAVMRDRYYEETGKRNPLELDRRAGSTEKELDHFYTWATVQIKKRVEGFKHWRECYMSKGEKSALEAAQLEQVGEGNGSALDIWSFVTKDKAVWEMTPVAVIVFYTQYYGSIDPAERVKEEEREKELEVMWREDREEERKREEERQERVKAALKIREERRLAWEADIEASDSEGTSEEGWRMMDGSD